MRISQLAERTGDSPTTLRFYEHAGLLPSGRTPAGYRVYGQDAVGRSAFIWTRSQTTPTARPRMRSSRSSPAPRRAPRGGGDAFLQLLPGR
ncbi:MerR family DNA-binding transcriptional regulator [Streptomyces sparsogenes]|uniref:MerR family DNA-binding transcriptional regulator n=1 Tax=Streptomyces sparsogenes TaxID=67365 RepID=UPI0033E45F53